MVAVAVTVLWTFTALFCLRGECKKFEKTDLTHDECISHMAAGYTAIMDLGRDPSFAALVSCAPKEGDPA